MDTNPTNDYGPLPIDPDCYYTPKLAAQGIKNSCAHVGELAPERDRSRICADGRQID